MKEKILAFLMWTMSISCLSSVVDFEENLFEGFDKNAPEGNRAAMQTLF